MVEGKMVIFSKGRFEEVSVTDISKENIGYGNITDASRRRSIRTWELYPPEVIIIYHKEIRQSGNNKEFTLILPI